MYVRRPCLLSVLPLFNLFIVSFFHTQSMLLGEIFIVMTASLINSVVMFLLVLCFLILNLVFLEMRECYPLEILSLRGLALTFRLLAALIPF